MDRIRLLAAALLVITLPVLAQTPPDPGPAIEAVGQAAFLAGEWAGDGWIQMGPGPREEFTQTETVSLKLEGALLLIEGLGYSKDEKSKESHQAMAVLSFDPVSRTPVFSSFMAGRSRLDVVPNIAPGSCDWSFSPPNGGEIRYSIRIEGERWRETGEYSRDGESWSQFFEMDLKRQ